VTSHTLVNECACGSGGHGNLETGVSILALSLREYRSRLGGGGRTLEEFQERFVTEDSHLLGDGCHCLD